LGLIIGRECERKRGGFSSVSGEIKKGARPATDPQIKKKSSAGNTNDRSLV
jgi:hypothetical protein